MATTDLQAHRPASCLKRKKPLALDEVTLLASALNTRPNGDETPVEVLRGDAFDPATLKHPGRYA